MRCLQVLLREPFTCAHHDTSTTTTTSSSSYHHHRRHHHRSHHHHLPVDQPSRDSRGSPHRLDLTSLHLASPTDHQPIDLLVRFGVTLLNALLLPYRPIPPARVAPDHSSLYLPLAPCTPLYTHLRNISRAPYFHRRPDLAGHLITATTDLTRVTAVLSPPIPE